MKISQLMLAKGFGGAERHFLDLSRELAARGDAVQAICHSNFSRLDELRALDGVDVVTVPVYGLWDRLAEWRIKRALARFRPDAAQVHLARAAHLGGAAAKSLAIPVCANTHNFLKLKYYRAVQHFITPTTRLQHYLEEHQIEARRITHIPHFSVAREAPAPRADRPIKFVAVGRLVEKKGYAVLLEAMATLVGAGVDASLSLAGDGPERGKLEQRSRELGLSEKVRFLGWVDDPHDAFNDHDIFVLPSLFEPFGIVVLEAMAAHLAIISSRSDGPLEILNDETAWFAEVGDPLSLSEAMIAAATDHPARKAKSDAAFLRFCDYYSADVMIPRYQALYADLAGLH